MPRRRVFIAINLPEDIKRSLAPFQKKWSELPVRWTKPENLHITLNFLGYLPDEEILDVCKILKGVSQRHSSFEINLTKICYGPPLSAGQTQDKKVPRMVWVIGERSKEFTALKNDLDNSLGNFENREFAPHITLGRIRQWEWQRIELEERPLVEEDINLSFFVESIEVMESVLKRGGPEYIILESIKLSETRSL